MICYHKYSRLSHFFGGKMEFSEVPQLIRASYFLPTEGNMFWAILDTQHLRIQPNKSQRQTKLSHHCLLIHYYPINNN